MYSDLPFSEDNFTFRIDAHLNKVYSVPTLSHWRAQPKEVVVMKTKSVRKPTSIAFMPEVVEYLDKKSHEAWMSRSTYLNKIIYDMMIDEETKEESTNE